MTHAQLAEPIGLSHKTVYEIIQSQAEITSKTAIQLESVFGIPADFWMEMERRYWLKINEINASEILISLKN